MLDKTWLVRGVQAVGLLTPLLAHADVVSDSSLALGTRNFYIDRDFKEDNPARSRVGSWTQGFDLRFASGYTEGPVQFGLDAAVQYAYRLDGGGGRGDDTIIPYSRSRQEQADEYGRGGVTLKMRYSKTELKLGELRPILPVVVIDDSRQLVTTYRGGLLESREIDGLTLTAGRLTQIGARNSSNYEKMYLQTGSGLRRTSDGLNFAGASYAFSPSLTGSYFYAQLEDIYQQHYLGVTHLADLGAGYALKTDLRYFNNSEDGDALYGDIDNRSYGAMTTLKKSGHAFGVGYQRMLGDSNFPTLAGYVPQPFLVNWSRVAFIKPNEKSWQARYDYDFAAIGVPGLKFMTRYLKGTSVDRGANLSQAAEHERNLVLSYVVQSGPLKGVGVEAGNVVAKFSHGNDWVENRLITTYTWKFW
ncbi:OprD family porin [Pseudomonas sp. R5(2019)]|uniref:OprD family porin n=1 Tax=Pseudomonas sp. R5(2019) TaxID=2697566 RepID=UPI00141226B1|nr:OprD family porin [Pseudomonas sp. R5(2019)]NBA94258.1 outer membrane porin, OprD family [Pseudomonas sp. R5(2019)]